ncbi:MAG: MarR family transcriptional regulator [Methylobacterium frigidaeris]
MQRPAPVLFTDLVLEVFRLNGALLAAGDALTRDLGLTSARWQVLGAVALSGRPLTVAGVARAMGLSRQAVRRVVADLAEAGLVGLEANPDHRRAALVVLSPAGQRAYAQASARQERWAARVGRECRAEALADALALLRLLSAALDRDAADRGEIVTSPEENGDDRNES